MRTPDLIIGPRHNPQTYRWHLIKWRGWQLALHKWWRSDEDRALHDHSGHNMSVILSPQGYVEIVRRELPYVAMGPATAYGGYQDMPRRRFPFVPYFRRADAPHRVVLRDARPVWTLWLRWPPIREWGFHCPRGWRHWKDFCNSRDYSTPGSTSEVGRGCD